MSDQEFPPVIVDLRARTGLDITSTPTIDKLPQGMRRKEWFEFRVGDVKLALKREPRPPDARQMVQLRVPRYWDVQPLRDDVTRKGGTFCTVKHHRAGSTYYIYANDSHKMLEFLVPICKNPAPAYT